MLNPSFLLNVALALFSLLYFMSTLLMTGYLFIKTKFSSSVFKQMVFNFCRNFFTLQAVTQRRLNPSGYDYKIYIRFQKRYTLYYFGLWTLLFIILFLAAKKYLNAF